MKTHFWLRAGSCSLLCLPFLTLDSAAQWANPAEPESRSGHSGYLPTPAQKDSGQYQLYYEYYRQRYEEELERIKHRREERLLERNRRELEQKQQEARENAEREQQQIQERANLEQLRRTDIERVEREQQQIIERGYYPGGQPSVQEIYIPPAADPYRPPQNLGDFFHTSPPGYMSDLADRFFDVDPLRDLKEVARKTVEILEDEIFDQIKEGDTPDLKEAAKSGTKHTINSMLTELGDRAVMRFINNLPGNLQFDVNTYYNIFGRPGVNMLPWNAAQNVDRHFEEQTKLDDAAKRIFDE